MFDKLEDLLIRYENIQNELVDPEVTNDQKRFRQLMKEQNDLGAIVEKYKEIFQIILLQLLPDSNQFQKINTLLIQDSF